MLKKLKSFFRKWLWMTPMVGGMICSEEDLPSSKNFAIGVTIYVTILTAFVSGLIFKYGAQHQHQYNLHLACILGIYILYLICISIIFNKMEKVENARKSENPSN